MRNLVVHQDARYAQNRKLCIEVNYSCKKLHATRKDSICIAYGFYSQTLAIIKRKSAVYFKNAFKTDRTFFAQGNYLFNISLNAEPISAKLLTVFTPAASSAANFSSAVPFPPLIMAPACPMRLPFGAVTPAM